MMTFVTLHWFYGTVTGLIIAAFVVLLHQLLGRAVSTALATLPKGRNRQIRGEWDTTFTKGAQTYTEAVTVYQIRHLVWGKIKYKDKNRVYHFRGNLRDQVLIGTYEVQDRSILDRGAFTLVLGFGNKLSGKYAWTDDETESATADNYEWKQRS
jgi:hypothetical protein